MPVKVRIFKELMTYISWSMLALLMGISYMRLVLGPNDASEEGYWYLLHLFYDVGLIYVGMWVGGCIALCFVLMDVFYLRKKLIDRPNKTIIRLTMMIAITALVGMAHYLLEKVIDVI